MPVDTEPMYFHTFPEYKMLTYGIESSSGMEYLEKCLRSLPW